MSGARRLLNVRGIWADAKADRMSYLLTGVASFGGMLFGWDTGLIGGILTMSSFKHSFGLDHDPSNYANLSGNIVSVLQAGCFFGALASFWISDVWGRKPALIIADVVFLLGSLLQVCSGIKTESLALLYAGRVIGGTGVGLISAVAPTYIAENVSARIRGRCIGAFQLFNVTGICLAYFVNYGCDRSLSDSGAAQWRVPFALQMLPGVLLLGGMIFQNESPRWLVEKRRVEEAKSALARVRAKPVEDPTVEEELLEIIRDFEGHEKMSLALQFKAACSGKKVFYRFSMAVILMFWQQWTGTNSINYYSPQIFESIGIQGSSASLFATGIYGVVKIVFTAIALILLTDAVGRKWSLMAGGIGQAFAMFYIGVSQALHPVETGAPLSGNSIFAIISIYLFVSFYSVSWGPIPFVSAAECAPNHIRSLVMAASLMTQWGFNLVIAKITPILLANITYGTFLLFGSCSLVAVVYVAVCVPETARMPLESIHYLFEGDIIRGAMGDISLKHSRAAQLRDQDSTPESSSNKGPFALQIQRARAALYGTTSA